MKDFLMRSAWAVGIVGVVSIIFGFAILIWPNITIEILVKAFGLLAFVQGISMAISAVANKHQHAYWVLSLLWGFFGIVAGLYVFANPGISAVVLLFVIAAYALVRGVLDIVMGIILREEVRNEWLYIIGGFISVLFGLYVLRKPLDGAIAIIWLIAIYSILSGGFYIATAFALRSLGKNNGLKLK